MSRNKALFLFFLIFLPPLPFSAQQNTGSGEHSRTIDSLNTLLKSATHDTTRLRLLNEFIENENDDKIWQPYNEQMTLLAEKLAQNSSKKNIFLRFPILIVLFHLPKRLVMLKTSAMPS